MVLGPNQRSVVAPTRRENGLSGRRQKSRPAQDVRQSLIRVAQGKRKYLQPRSKISEQQVGSVQLEIRKQVLDPVVRKPDTCL
jgi:hypothetical protein